MLVGYTRVSKSETKDITAQIQALKAIGCDKIFEEAAIGGRWDRPELDRMLDELQAHDVIVVQSLDRLTSSLKDLLFVLEKIYKCGAYFRTITESIDTPGPSEQMVMHMLRSLADFERAQVRERTGEGLRAARARGHGGGRTPKLSPTQKQERMDMLAAGPSAAGLVRLFRVHPATISRLAAKTQQIKTSALEKVPQTFLNLAKFPTTLSLGHNGDVGPKRGRTEDQLAAISGALSLVANILMTWNTLHIENARAEAPEILTDDIISKVAPVAHGHFNLRGMFKFDLGAHRSTLLEPNGNIVQRRTKT